MGLNMSPHDPCVFLGKLRDDLPPIYIGIYVDDFKYFSLSDETEDLFEKHLASKCRVDFMGEVSWFLGSKYEWEDRPDGRLTVSITQTAKIEELIDTHRMSNCNPASSPYRSGHAIDRIPAENISLGDKTPLVKKYQSLVGGLLWVQRHTHPEISAAVSLLSSYSHNPTADHYYTAGKRVLAWLQGTLKRGICFTTQGGTSTSVNVSFPIDPNSAFPTSDGVYCDANWGPQDASHPKDSETTSINKVQSLLGHIVFRLGGPLSWGCTREPRSDSRSSCESEIHSTDEATKSALTTRHLLQDLGLPDGKFPTPIWNNNCGCVDWCKGVSVSRKLRHINMRELAVRLVQTDGHVCIRHIPGKHNIADLFTKEIKDPTHFRNTVFTITSPRLVADLQIFDLSPQTESEGGIGGGEPTGAFATEISTPVGNSEFVNRHL